MDLMNCMKPAIMVVSCYLCCGPSLAENLHEGLIETRILPADPQSGVKSQHFYFIDFEDETVVGSFESGTTNINLGIIEFNIGSVRDNFKIEDVSFSGDQVSFRISGTTASGVLILPDIDYNLRIIVARDGGIVVGGCHDAYPAYLIQHNGMDLYRFDHKPWDQLKLVGTCDQPVSVSK